MGFPLGEGVWLKGTERDMGRGVKNVHVLGDVLNGCSQTASTIATSIVHAILDYCSNSLFLNMDVTQINRLQIIQSALASRGVLPVLLLKSQNTTTSLLFSKLAPN